MMLGAAEVLPLDTATSPAFYVALVLYGLAAILYVGVFTSARPWVVTGGRLALIGAFCAHGIDIGWRGVEQVHPGTSVREALGFLSWIFVGGYLIASVRHRLQVMGAFVAPAAMAILSAARLTPTGEAMEGLGTLGRIHISLATLGVAIFGLATGLAAIYLLEDRNLKRKQFDRVLFKRGVALDTLDNLAHKLILVGFPIFTVAIMLGVIWVSQRASGFDRVEYPLAAVTWLAFAVLIVARTTRGVRGKRAALLTVLGFTAAVLVMGVYLVRRTWGG
jgi:ABC-type uncharacterized transport system permease subunit